MYLSDTSCEPVRRSVRIKADVSLHTMQRLVASCPARSHVHMRAAGSFGFGTVVGIELLSKLAQSDVVEGIYLGCSGRMQPNGQ